MDDAPVDDRFVDERLVRCEFRDLPPLTVHRITVSMIHHVGTLAGLGVDLLMAAEPACAELVEACCGGGRRITSVAAACGARNVTLVVDTVAGARRAPIDLPAGGLVRAFFDQVHHTGDAGVTVRLGTR